MSSHDNFYRVFVDLYDRFFPLTDALAVSVDRLLRDHRGRSILDVGCGTGSLVLALRDLGYSVEGTDSSAEMIDVARDKAAVPKGSGPESSATLGAAFHVESMEDLSVRASGLSASVRRYDALLCLGNTMAHAHSYEGVREIVVAMRALLRPQGLLLIQGIDFSYVAEHGVRELAVIESDGFSLHRSYGQTDGEGRIRFSIRIDGPGDPLGAGTTLLALDPAGLQPILVKAGFADVERLPSLSGSGDRSGIEMVIAARA